jgi:hypothetical protein
MSNLFSPNEAEASPIGKMGKAISPLLRKSASRSSSADLLIGQTLEGKVIKDVLKGRGNWREIIYEDGTNRAVDTETLEYIMRRKGTEKQDAIFQNASPTERDSIAEKSLNLRRKISENQKRDMPYTGGKRETVRQHVKGYFTDLKELGEPLPGTVMVQDLRPGGMYHSMQTEKARNLEKRGIVKIVKGKPEEKLFTPFLKPKE